MKISWLILTGVALIAALLAALAYLAALSRHKKGGTHELKLVGARGVAESDIGPEGSVLVQGEIWPARSGSGAKVARGTSVRIVGVSAHLLEVEPFE
jgi:membrane-bound ClpP family serine protease